MGEKGVCCLGGGRPRPRTDSHSKALKGLWTWKAAFLQYRKWKGLSYLGPIVLNPGQLIGSQGAFQRALRDHFFPFKDEA
jgi:hypothetical protein